MKLPPDLQLWECQCGAFNSARIIKCPKCFQDKPSYRPADVDSEGKRKPVETQKNDIGGHTVVKPRTKWKKGDKISEAGFCESLLRHMKKDQ